jgi:hypothetical protein
MVTTRTQENAAKLWTLLAQYHRRVEDAIRTLNIDQLLEDDVFYEYRLELKRAEQAGKLTSTKPRTPSLERVLKWGLAPALGVVLFFVANEINQRAQITSQSRTLERDRSISLPDINSIKLPEPYEPANPARLPIGASPMGKGVRNGNSTLTVDNGTVIDALVKLVRVSPRAEMIRNFYIPANSKLTAERIPPGRYVLRVAFGLDWASHNNRFNFRRSFSETDAFIISEEQSTEYTKDGYTVHTRASEMTITLHKVPEGNFKSKEITEEDFRK